MLRKNVLVSGTAGGGDGGGQAKGAQRQPNSGAKHDGNTCLGQLGAYLPKQPQLGLHWVTRTAAAARRRPFPQSTAAVATSWLPKPLGGGLKKIELFI